MCVTSRSLNAVHTDRKECSFPCRADGSSHVSVVTCKPSDLLACCGNTYAGISSYTCVSGYSLDRLRTGQRKLTVPCKSDVSFDVSLVTCKPMTYRSC